MKNEELIKRLAEPIIEKLIAIEENSCDSYGQAPTVHLTLEESSAVGDAYFDDQLIRELESYVQEQLDNWFKPTILH